MASATPVMAQVESAGSARSQSEEAYLRIRERIVSLDMPPGSVVNESRLRQELKIGRTPIREALQRLARENLVRSVPHRGTFVTDVNITDLARPQGSPPAGCRPPIETLSRGCSSCSRRDLAWTSAS